MAQKLDKLRDPGHFERYNIHRNFMRFYHSVGCTGQYKLNFGRKVTRAALYAAFRATVVQHPAMCCTVVDEGTQSPYFAKLSSIDLDNVVEFVPQFESDQEWLAKLEKVHDIPFDKLPDMPIWRAIVAQSGESEHFTIIFLIHHAVGDGKSAAAFHNTFRSALAEVIEETSNDSTVSIPDFAMIPPVEQAMALPLSLSYITKSVYRGLIKPKKDDGLFTGSPITTDSHITKLDAIILPDSAVQMLLSRCREQAVSLNALLVVLIARNFAQVFPNYPRFCGVDAMALRRFCNVGENAMVNYVSSITHKFSREARPGFTPCSGEFSWDAVKAVKKEIEIGTSSSQNLIVGLLKFLPDNQKFFRSQLGKKRNHSFEVSNIGVMGEEGSDQLQIRRIVFSQSADVTGSPCSFSVATARGGDLSICLSWQKGVIDDKEIKQIADGVRQDLEMLAAAPASTSAP